MKIKYLAHASFLVTANSGTRILTDPYTTNKEVNYSPIKDTADVVTVSHGHGDHNNVAGVPGNPVKIDKDGRITVKGIEFNGIAAYHDDNQGKQRGSNIIFCFTVDGVRLCHLGDLGHRLDSRQLKDIGKVDVLLIPVGGFFTIDAKTAGEVAAQIGAGMVIPMHYLTDKLKYPINDVDGFLKGKDNVIKKDTSEIEVKPATKFSGSQIVVLKPALL